MTRTLGKCLALSVALLCAGCDAKPPVSGAESPPPPIAKPAQIAPVSDAQATAFAEKVTRVVQIESGSDDLVDWDGLLNRAASGLNMKPSSLAGFQAGMISRVETYGSLRQVRDLIKQGGNYKHIRTHQTAEGTRVTMRLMLSGGGLNYHDYLIQDRNGHIDAVDFYIAATGEDMSQTFRRMLIPIVAHDNRGLLDGLSGKEILQVNHLGDLQKATKLIQGGEYPQSLQTLNSLPIELQNEKFILVMRLSAAQGANDDAATLESFERLRSQYPSDPATALHSINYYAIKKEYPKLIEAIRQLDQSVGGDACLSCLFANALLETGDIPGAKAAVEKAIATEPELRTSYWTRVTIAVAEQDNATLLKTLKYIHDELMVTLSAESIQSDPVYSKFILTPEFKELEKLLEE